MKRLSYYILLVITNISPTSYQGQGWTGTVQRTILIDLCEITASPSLKSYVELYYRVVQCNARMGIAVTVIFITLT